MRSKVLFFLVGLFLAGLYLAWTWVPARPARTAAPLTSRAVESSRPQQIASLTRSENSFRTKDIRTPRSAPAASAIGSHPQKIRVEKTNPYDLKPDGNQVEFEIKHGWAVAYGDVLLGKPRGVVPGGHAVTEAPSPRYWDTPEIPYLISQNLPDPSRVKQALRYLRDHTPVRFVPATSSDRDLIVFETGKENCYSYLGRIGGAQPIRLAAGCTWLEILHEVMHALGFVHEQSRTDRSQYVKILWDNILPGYRMQFSIVPDSFMDAESDTPFDYHSIMLYEPDAFALKKGLPTMKSTGSDLIAPTRTGLSPGDIERIKRLFRMD